LVFLDFGCDVLKEGLLMCRFLVCELAVHIFEVIVCFGQLFIFSAEGEAGGAIFDGKLHLGYH
jgi:hypothetical protein